MKKKFSSLCDFNDESVFNVLLKGIESEKRQHLLELMIDACQIHSNLFLDDFWFEELDGDYPIEYVLPALRRAYASFFIQIPPLLKNDERRVELFQLNFNLEEFLTEVSTKAQTVKRLSEFEHIDKASTILQLIVDNYVGGKIKMTRVDNLTQTIREIKLEKHLKL
jgi:hypothetical protein